MNGELSEEFKPTAGIRQGDPISPYLFILSLNIPSFSLNKLTATGDIKPIKLSKHDPVLSHLFFIDDSLFALEASFSNQVRFKETLNHFCEQFGQKINVQKSCFMVSPNLDSYLLPLFT